MKKLIFPVLCILFLAGCSGLQPSDFVQFNTSTKTVNLSGFSDTTYEYYIANYPADYTPEKIKEERAAGRNSFCGRISDFQKQEMVEFHIRYPEGTVLKKEDFQSLKGKNIMGLNQKNNNYDSLTKKITGPYLDFFYVDKTGKQFLSIDPTDILRVTSVEVKSDSIALIKGDFELNMNEFGKNEKEKVKGQFALDFYIGL